GGVPQTGQRGWLSRQELLRDDPIAGFFGLSPFSLFRRWGEDWERLLGGQSAVGFGGRFAPQIDVREEDGKLKVHADLPGCKPEDFRVEVQDDTLILSGERRSEREQSRGGVHRSERTYGSFRRLIPLPPGADIEGAQANFDNGVLEITIPLAEPKAKRIDVHTGAQQETGGGPHSPVREPGSSLIGPGRGSGLGESRAPAGGLRSSKRQSAIALATTGEGCSLPKSPSQRATTAVARQLPITLTEVRPMSINSSIPSKMN